MPDGANAAALTEALEVNAIVKFDNENGYWVGEFHWDELVYKSDKKSGD